MSIWRKQHPAVSSHNDDAPATTVAEALVAVRGALQLHTQDGSDVNHLRVPIRQLCVFARQNNLPPEQLLVQLKHMLSETHELDVLGLDKREDVRSRVVEFTIESYFDDGR
ncbi:MAG TPA: hypothetical protein VGM67_03775 [Gemmatimonadaceae bacterium]|jgi:hypothetical protein